MLRSKGNSNWTISGAYAWTMGSLDFLGASVYVSQGEGHHPPGAYNDDVIIAMIQAHNRATP